jgi:hypothetical protein
LHFYNLSAAEGPRWAEICTEFSEKIIKLGPSPVWLALKKKNNTSQKQETQPVEMAVAQVNSPFEEGVEKL